MRRYGFAGAALALVMFVAGCAGVGPPDRIEMYFVREGIAVAGEGISSVRVESAGGTVTDWRGGSDGGGVVRLGPDKALAVLEWSPGESFEITVEDAGGIFAEERTAPQKPSPFRVAVIELEKVDAHVSGMGTAPDTFVKFSPGARRLAIGSFRGYLRVADTRTGEVLLTKKIAEGMVKRIGWGSIDGRQVLYAGEQSPDGFLYCFDATSGEEIWKYRLADDIEYSKPAVDHGHFAMYFQPGVYQLEVTPGGDVLVVGSHGWYRGEDYINKCVVYRFDGRTGEIKWRWPADMALPHGITWFAASGDGARIVLHTSNWVEAKTDHETYREGTLYCIDGATGATLWQYAPPPLEPYFNKASAWQGIDISSDGGYAVLGLNDGRALFFDAGAQLEKTGGGPPVNEPIWEKRTGTPIEVGGIPVAAHITYAAIGRDEVYLMLPGTTIPPSAGSSRKQKPAPHPAANHLFAYGFDGTLEWKWNTPGSTQGAFLTDDGRWLATVTADVYGEDETDFFGVSMFDTTAAGGGKEKLSWMYSTEGPVFFMADISPGGRFVAATETPLRLSDNKTVVGKYRVHIIH